MTVNEFYMKGYERFQLEIIDNRGEVITDNYGKLHGKSELDDEEILYFEFEDDNAPYLDGETKAEYKVIAHLVNAVRYKVE